MTDTQTPEQEEQQKRRWEIIFGTVVTLFAAMLALNELAGGKYGDDKLELTSEKTSAYLWYQSKGIKSNLIEGQRDLLKTLGSSGVVATDKTAFIDKQVADLDKKIAKYDKEKDEILRGSSAVGKDNWAQEINGELGKVPGVQQIEKRVDELGAAGDKFDVATLFLQVSLVLGAIGIIITNPRMKRMMLIAMTVGGAAGVSFFVMALRLAGFFAG